MNSGCPAVNRFTLVVSFLSSPAKNRAFLFGRAMSKTVCRDCPNFDFSIVVSMGDAPMRIDMRCMVDEQMAGIRTECNRKPDRDTGERRRVADMGGDAS